VCIFIQAMKTKHILTAHIRTLICISIAVLLSACGPGTGGTGTGPINVVATAPAPSTPTTPATSAITTPGSTDSRLVLFGLWNSTSLQAQAYFDTKHIVFRKGCIYFEFVGEWSAKIETNSDQTVSATAEGYTWQARLSNSKLTIRVTDTNGNVLIDEASLMQAPAPQSKPTPSSICEG
jgi:hypothetical protein